MSLLWKGFFSLSVGKEKNKLKSTSFFFPNRCLFVGHRISTESNFSFYFSQQLTQLGRSCGSCWYGLARPDPAVVVLNCRRLHWVRGWKRARYKLSTSSSSFAGQPGVRTTNTCNRIPWRKEARLERTWPMNNLALLTLIFKKFWHRFPAWSTHSCYTPLVHAKKNFYQNGQTLLTRNLHICSNQITYRNMESIWDLYCRCTFS